jgi:hypothetical protein
MDRRRVWALSAYAVLLGLSFATISDRRLLLMSVALLLVFMGLTLFHERREAPTAAGRAADLGWDDPNGSPAETDERREEKFRGPM